MSEQTRSHASTILSPTSNSSSEPRLRTLNVEVPEEVYWHVRECATESRLSMKEYMAKFCREAWPYPPGGQLGTSPQTADRPATADTWQK